MATPTITAVTPSAGHTGGQTLVEITGTNFRVPTYPPAEGVTETPVTVRVTFGGEEATLVGVVDEETLLVLTPSHDESGVPATSQNEAIAASDVIVENLDDNGAPIAGESATLAEAFSFRKPILNVPTTAERVIQALIVQIQRALPRGVDLVYSPHTDFDDDSGDALNSVAFARLPGVGLTGLRMPKSQIMSDRGEQVVEIDADRSVTRRAPIKRDLVLTVVAASDNRDELLRLDVALQTYLEKLTTIRITKNLDDADRGYAEYDVIYGHGEVVLGDRQGNGNVMATTGELQVFGIEETDILGVPGGALSGAPAWLPHEATTGIVWKVREPSARMKEP